MIQIRWRLPIIFAVASLLFAGIVALSSALVLREVYLGRLETDMAHQVQQYSAVLQAAWSPAGDTVSGSAAPGSAASGGTASGGAATVGLTPAALQTLTKKAGTAGDLRLTVIASDGHVLADSEADPATMENHAARPEVAQALAGHEGRARRYSSTIKEQLVYVAEPMPADPAAPWSKGVLRAAAPANQIDNLLSASWRVPLIVWAILLLPILGVGYFLTRGITQPLGKLRRMAVQVARGDLDSRNSVRRKDELGELAVALNDMASELQSRVRRLAAEEERSDELLNAMSDGMLLVDEDGHFLKGNPAAGAILGANLEGLEGRPLVQAARSFPARALAQKAAASGQPMTEVLELPGRRYLSVEVIPLRLSEDQRPQTLFIIRDETARLRTERMRRDFATNVSHELKTPLAGLSLLAETLQDAIRESPEEAERFAARLSLEIDRLSDLTSELLTLSRLEDETAPEDTNLVQLDLARLADETAAELRPLATNKNQELTVEAPLGVPVRADEIILRTLMRNLLDNAIRYTDPDGHILASVRSDHDSSGQDWAILSVKDDGVGIPVAEQQRIFERFYRVDKARSRETGGTGLGLSIVRHVAERHGGRVTVESTVGVGSTFTVWLPLAAD